MPELARNVCVSHPAHPEWGIGRVTRVVDSDKVEVVFTRAGKKLLKGVTLNVEPERSGIPSIEQLLRPKSQAVRSPGAAAVSHFDIDAVTDEQLVSRDAWQQICREAEGRVDPEEWKELCRRRGYLLYRRNPRGF